MNVPAAAKRVTAMVRARNEEEFLYASVSSIVDLVDDVVIVDNGSTDGTPGIISRLRSEHGEKLVAHHYPHRVRRVGAENWELARSEETRASPELSANFYNWCLARCAGTHVLKWDADMIAIPTLESALGRWRESDAQVMVFFGANVHSDRHHLMRSKITDPSVLLARLSLPKMPDWVTALAHDYPEPRLFAMSGARYTSNPWTQMLESPYFPSKDGFEIDEPCYLHVKFCKREPLANYSSDLAEVIASNIGVGVPLEPGWRQTLQRWGIA